MARKLELDYVTAWTWSTGGVRLLVARLLLICEKLGVSIAEFLTSDTFAPSSTDARSPLVPAAPAYAYNTVKKPCRPSAALLKHVEAHLGRAINAEVLPPPTLEAVRHEGGLTFPYAHQHFPNLCRVLSSRWKAWKHADGIKRRELLASEVRDVAVRFHSEGIDPNNMRVARALSKPGAMRDIVARTALRKIRQHLGLEDLERRWLRVKTATSLFVIAPDNTAGVLLLAQRLPEIRRCGIVSRFDRGDDRRHKLSARFIKHKLSAADNLCFRFQ